MKIQPFTIKKHNWFVCGDLKVTSMVLEQTTRKTLLKFLCDRFTLDQKDLEGKIY